MPTARRQFGGSSLLRDEAPECPKCGDELVWRPAHPFPVVLQIAFGGSCVIFLLTLDRLARYPHGKAMMWGWTAAQAALGVLLVARRRRAQRRVLRCIRCG